MKVLVLGASGMAGHVIATHLAEQGHDVTRVAGTRRTTPDTVLLDLCSPGALDAVPVRGCDVVVNAVGVLVGDAARDKARTVWLNSCLPHRLASMLRGAGTMLVHLSTDCVFSGNEGSYTECAQPDAETFYGRSKALGEAVDTQCLTLRQSLIGPDLSPDGAGLFAWFMRQRGAVKGWRRARWNGVTTIELAYAVEAAIGQGIAGLYHLAPPQPTTKHALLTLIADAFRPEVLVEPTHGVVEDKTLVDTRGGLSYKPPDYWTQIERMRAWVDRHPDLYPHYLMELT